MTGAFLKAEGESGHRDSENTGEHYVILEAEVGVTSRSCGRSDHTYQHPAFRFQAFRTLRQVLLFSATQFVVLFVTAASGH